MTHTKENTEKRETNYCSGTLRTENSTGSGAGRRSHTARTSRVPEVRYVEQTGTPDYFRLEHLAHQSIRSDAG
ncbi:MAG: hypothetical protein WC593_13705 [Methanoregula sp.]